MGTHSKGWHFLYLIGRVGMHAAAGVLILLMLAITFNSIVRYVFGGGIHLILELAPFGMLFMVFMSLAGTHLLAGHVSVDLVTAYLRPGVRHFLHSYFQPVVSIVYVMFILWSGLIFAMRLLKGGTTTTGVVPIPLGPMMIIVPIGSVLLILALLAVMVKALRERKTTRQQPKV